MKQKRSDGRYQVSVYLGKDDEGKRIRKTFYGKTQKEAKAKAEEFKNAGKLKKNFTVSDLIEKYSDTISDTTTLNRLKYFSVHLPNVPAEELNASDIESVLRKLALHNDSTGKPTSERTLTRYLNCVKSAYDYGIRNRYLSFNPCQYVKLPKAAPKKERHALTLEEVHKLEQYNHRGRIAVMLMAYCGLRRGELTALTWEDVDTKRGIIKINKSFDYKNNQLKSTKTISGIRTLPIPQMLLNELKTAKKSKKNTDSVITCVDGSQMTESAWKRMNETYVKQTGIEFTWHELRHTCATMLFNADVDVQTAKKLLGHKDITTTMAIYTHLQEAKEQQSIDKLNLYLEKNSSQIPVK